MVPDARKLLKDENLMVRMRAAEFLGSIKAMDPMPALLSVLNSATTEQELMLTFNAVVYLRDYKGYKFDNSKLDCRIQGLTNYSPKRVILDKNLSIRQSSYIFQTSNKKNTYIIYNNGTKEKINQLKKKGVKLIKLEIKTNEFFDLRIVLKELYTLGCRNLLVEGGKTLTNNFLKDNLFNQFFLFQSGSNIGKNAKLNVATQLRQLSFKYKTKCKLNSFTGNDIIYLYS